MDFVKKILHQISRKSEAVSQITFDEDYNVPDARPDVGRMIQKKGEVTIGDADFGRKSAYSAASPFICCTSPTANGAGSASSPASFRSTRRSISMV